MVDVRRYNLESVNSNKVDWFIGCYAMIWYDCTVAYILLSTAKHVHNKAKKFMLYQDWQEVHSVHMYNERSFIVVLKSIFQSLIFPF